MKEKHAKHIISILSLFAVIVLSVSLLSLLMCDSHAEIQSGIVADGVYALKNKATGQYLDIQYNSPNEEMLIQQYAYNNVPSSDSERSGLFKFKHYANDYYVIRTMRNNANSFYRKNNYEVRTCAIDPNDSNNSYYDS